MIRLARVPDCLIFRAKPQGPIGQFQDRVSTKLMVRMGHDSERAALIYLHSSAARQRALADAVGDAARAELAKSKKPKDAKLSGTRMARNRRRGDRRERDALGARELVRPAGVQLRGAERAFRVSRVIADQPPVPWLGGRMAVPG
jgi:predicted ATPase with chaperone activity